MSTSIRFATIMSTTLFVAACTTTPTTTVKTPAKPTIKQPVIAVALGGGGAKGFAHIGALKVLESHGIKPKIVTGTSAGSFVGSLYASGKSPYQLQKMALSLKESDVTDLTLSKQGFVRGQKLQNFVNKNVGNKAIQQFPKRFAAVATELNTGKKVAFNRGNAGQAVRASCSIPNIFVPARISGKRYVDGGLVSPIPVTTARDMGADIVIAIDISAKPKKDRPLNLWALLDQTLNIMSLGAIDAELKYADVVIRPAVGHVGTLDLTQRHDTMLAGERAAQKQLPALKKAIANYKAKELQRIKDNQPKPKRSLMDKLLFKSAS